MIDTSLRSYVNQYVPYQFGRGQTAFLFPLQEINPKITRSIKTSTTELKNAPGNFDSRGFEPNFKAAFELSMNVQIKNDSLHLSDYLTRLMYDVNVDIIFFIRYDLHGDVRFFYNYARFLSGKDNQQQNQSLESYSLDIQLYYPFFFEIEYYRLTLLDANQAGNAQLYGATIDTYGSTSQPYGNVSTNANYVVDYSTLSKDEIKALFNTSKLTNQYLDYKDNYIKQEIAEQRTTETLTFSLTNNNLIGFSSEDLDLQTTAKSNVNLVYIPYNFALNDSISMYIQETKSGFTFHWLDSASSPEILINTAFNTAYDYATNTRIDRSKYRLVNYSNDYSKGLLIFPALASINNVWKRYTTNILCQKNTSGNITDITITNLKIYN